jgi:hypothetical protein
MSYKMMTAAEAVDYLFALQCQEKKLNFTFDDLDIDPDCDPSGWHGAQMTKIFDEYYGIFAIGYWGGGSTFAYDIYCNVYDVDDCEEVKEFCTQKLQQYMNDCWDSAGNCEKICVEIKED